jgi:pSer/pThr/pTyr-binding forkhead associated (FHA) protein
MTKRRLVINCTDLAQFCLVLEGGCVSIGSSRDHPDSVLQHLRVTRLRCELEVEGDHITARSAKIGTAGVPYELQPGAVLKAGPSQLCLEPAAGDVAGEDIGLVPTDEQAPAPATARPDPAAGEAQLARQLVVIEGANRGQFFPLPESGNMTLGKNPKHADIVLHDLYVARVHCWLEITPDKIVVVDQSEGLGTLINGQKITRHELNVGDVLRLGNSHLKLEVVVAAKDSPGAAKPGGEAEDEMVLEVADDEAGAEDEDAPDEDIEVVEDDEEETEVLPAGASEAARLLRLWRHKLTQLSGQTLGHYRLGPLLGRGRCGVVFRAEDLKTSQPVALKVFSPQFPHNDQEAQRFARTLKALLPLRHPHLVALSSAGKTGAYAWVAREYVEGESLVEVIGRLASARQRDWRSACQVAVQVGRALEFARKHRLRHGKVTPANILIQESDQVAKLADLMLGAALEGSGLWQAAQESRQAAELAYLAPEQAEPGAFVDELSDLYSLGAIVYALLTGRPPFLGDTADEILEQMRGRTKVARPGTFNPSVPAPLEKVVMKMLARRQEDRFQTPTALLAELEPLVQEQEES